MPHLPTLIIGAGASGLGAAKVLSDAGRSAMVIESRDRIGGRIHTISPLGWQMPVELGAEFIHGRPEATWRHVQEAGLTAYDLPLGHMQRHAGVLSSADPYEDAVEKIMAGLAKVKHDMSFADYVRSRRGKRNPQAEQRAIDFVTGFDAADPERISAKSLAREMTGVGDFEGEKQFRLLGGYGTLIEHLRTSLDRSRVKVELNTRVRQINWSRGRVEVVSERAGKRVVHRGSSAIITLPLGVLQIPPENGDAVRFAPELPAIRRAASKLGFGPVVKAVVRFSTPFWEDPAFIRTARATPELKDSSFLHAADAAFPTWWTMRPLRVPILTGWAGGTRQVRFKACVRANLRNTWRNRSARCSPFGFLGFASP